MSVKYKLLVAAADNGFLMRNVNHRRKNVSKPCLTCNVKRFRSCRYTIKDLRRTEERAKQWSYLFKKPG